MDGVRIAVDGFGVVQSDCAGILGEVGGIQSAARDALRQVLSSLQERPVFRLGQWSTPGTGISFDGFSRSLCETYPISIEAGFEGNAGVEGGVWRNEENEDALVYLRFRAGTVDLPLHVHEFSDRMILVSAGLGLFHYGPASGRRQELRSVVVEPGDVIAFSRGLLHTFTAPVCDLELLSFHSPFLALDDQRQFTVPSSAILENLSWCPAGLVDSQSTRVRRSVSA